MSANVDKAQSIRSVVIPVAGRGTRLLPASKGVRKELFPVGRKPLIAYAVDEAVASGVAHVIFVISPGETGLQRYFSHDAELESYLEQHGRADECAALRASSTAARFSFVTQPFQMGLADAIRCARVELTDTPFGVILPDAFILSEKPCMSQLIDSFHRHRGSVIATRIVQRCETSSYGILAFDSESEQHDPATLKVQLMKEKPKPDEAPSLYGVFGRYLLEPEIFDAIDTIVPNASGEMELTDALNLLCRTRPVYGCLFEGRHFDTGSWIGYWQAALDCMLQDASISPILMQRVVQPADLNR
jgi:UTP--glucose-1-phosphate uridylyltransferase